jgi:hypothetical protein
MANNGLNTQSQRINQQPAEITTYTNISVFLRGIKVGVIQNISRSESRGMNPVQELGTENVVQILPENTKGGTISIERMALYRDKFHQLLGSVDGQLDNRGDIFNNLFQQRVPFEIQVSTRTPSGQSTTETYVDVWLSDYRKSVAVGQIQISESVTANYAFVI